MEIESARPIVSMKEKGHFERENERVEKYTLGDELSTKLSHITLRRADARAAGATEAVAPAAGAERDRSMNKEPAWDYSVRRLTIDDKELVLQFLRKFFFRDEPMNQAVGLLETPESRCMALEEYATSSLEDAVSLAAVNDDGAVVGLVINGLTENKEPSEAVQVDKERGCDDVKFRRVLRLLAHLERHARMWSHAPAADLIMEIRIVSTDAAWRGRGLMRRLCEETEAVAREVGAGALRMDTTSAFSAAVAERLCYRRVYSVAYDALDGVPQPEPPHTHACVYVKTL